MDSIRKKIEYTSFILKRKCKINEEDLNSDIMKIKQKGLYLSSIDEDYKSIRVSMSWFKKTMKEIKDLNGKRKKKISGKNFTPLENFRNLKFLKNEKIDEFLKILKNVKDVKGTEPSKL